MDQKQGGTPPAEFASDLEKLRILLRPRGLIDLVNEPQTIPANELTSLLTKGGIDALKTLDIITILLWYGVLGVRRIDGTVIYIYNVNYEMPILKGIARKLDEEGLVYVVNAAFVPGLQIREDRNAL